MCQNIVANVSKRLKIIFLELFQDCKYSQSRLKYFCLSIAKDIQCEYSVSLEKFKLLNRRDLPLEIFKPRTDFLAIFGIFSLIKIYTMLKFA